MYSYILIGLIVIGVGSVFSVSLQVLFAFVNHSVSKDSTRSIIFKNISNQFKHSSIYRDLFIGAILVTIGLVFSESLRGLFGVVKYYESEEIRGSVVFKKNQSNSPEGLNVTVFSTDSDFTYGGFGALEQDFGDPKYTCIIRTEKGDSVEVRNEMLWGKVSPGDSIRVNYRIRENCLLGIRQPVIDDVHKY